MKIKVEEIERRERRRLRNELIIGIIIVILIASGCGYKILLQDKHQIEIYKQLQDTVK